MSEFFAKPEIQSYYDARAAADAEQRMFDKLALTPEIQQLQEAAHYLAGLLLAETTTVPTPDPSKPVALGERIEVVKAEPATRDVVTFFKGRSQPFHRVRESLPGWLVSKSKNYANSRGVVLLEDGTMVLTREPLAASRQAVNIGSLDLNPYLNPADLSLLRQVSATAKQNEISRNEFLGSSIDTSKLTETDRLLREDFLRALVPHKGVLLSPDLVSYKPHPEFATERGYVETNGKRPDLVVNEEVVHGTKAAYVAANLEHIGKDMRTVHRSL